MYQTSMDGAPRTGGAKLEPEIGGPRGDEPTVAGASVLDPDFGSTGAVTFAPSMFNDPSPSRLNCSLTHIRRHIT